MSSCIELNHPGAAEKDCVSLYCLHLLNNSYRICFITLKQTILSEYWGCKDRESEDRKCLIQRGYRSVTSPILYSQIYGLNTVSQKV